MATNHSTEQRKARAAAATAQRISENFNEVGRALRRTVDALMEIDDPIIQVPSVQLTLDLLVSRLDDRIENLSDDLLSAPVAEEVRHG